MSNTVYTSVFKKEFQANPIPERSSSGFVVYNGSAGLIRFSLKTGFLINVSQESYVISGAVKEAMSLFPIRLPVSARSGFFADI